MSMDSWRQEFYPTSADEEMNTLEAAEHSLRKWTGALPANLKKHDLIYKNAAVMSKDHIEVLIFDDMSCALCAVARSLGSGPPKCNKCPLAKMLGVQCDVNPDHKCTSDFCYTKEHNDHSVYARARSKPMVMVKVLRQLVKKLEEKRGLQTDERSDFPAE